MKKLLIILTGLSVAFSLLAAVSDSSASFRAHFLKYEWQPYEITQTVYTLHDGDTVALERLRFKADIYVADSSRYQYFLNWRFHDFILNTDSRKLQQLASLATPVTISCRVSEVGMLMDFVVWESVTTCLDEGMKTLLPEFANRKDSLAKAELGRMYDFRKSLEMLILRSVRQFHQLYGLGYTLGEVVDVPSVLFVAGVPDPIPGIVRKKLVKVDAETGIAMLSTVSYPDQKALKIAFENEYQTDSVPEQLFSQKISGSIVSDLNTGWVLYTFEQRESGAGKDISGELLELQHLEVELNQ